MHIVKYFTQIYCHLCQLSYYYTEERITKRVITINFSSFFVKMHLRTPLVFMKEYKHIRDCKTNYIIMLTTYLKEYIISHDLQTYKFERFNYSKKLNVQV